MTVERMLPLYEGKMGGQFDYRAASFVGVGDTEIEPNAGHGHMVVVQPRYWVRESVAEDRLRRREWACTSALLGFRRVARNTDERTAIAAVIPYGAASYGWILTAGPDAEALAILAGQYNSFAFDYVLRQFLSQPSIPQGTFEQIPTLTRERIAAHDHLLGSAMRWVVVRVGALLCTGAELVHFAQDLRISSRAWDPTERERLRTELDAAYFHFFGVERDDVVYIMETFPIVKRKDEATYGEYRTKRLILEVFDQMAEAIANGTSYNSSLDEELA